MYAPTVGQMLEKKEKRNLSKVLPSATIREAGEEAKRENTGSVCVIDEKGNLVRLVTDRDFRNAWLEGGDLAAPITSIGTPGDKVRTVDVSINVYECLGLFAKDIGHLPVKKDGEVFDLITKGDVLFAVFFESFHQSMVMEGRMPAE